MTFVRGTRGLEDQIAIQNTQEEDEDSIVSASSDDPEPLDSKEEIEEEGTLLELGSELRKLFRSEEDQAPTITNSAIFKTIEKDIPQNLLSIVEEGDLILR